MRIYFLLFIICSASLCFAQKEHKTRLRKTLEELKLRKAFSVTFNDTICPISGWLPWDPNIAYLATERICFKGQTFEAARDNQGKNPPTSPKEWGMVNENGPFKFLRDSATNDELINLTNSNSGLLKSYAFVVLAHRNYEQLFEILVTNLKDKEWVPAFFGSDGGLALHPADIMILYSYDKLSSEEKAKLKKLLSEYKHLHPLEDILEYKPYW